jgi:hypothetical protein
MSNFSLKTFKLALAAFICIGSPRFASCATVLPPDFLLNLGFAADAIGTAEVLRSYCGLRDTPIADSFLSSLAAIEPKLKFIAGKRLWETYSSQKNMRYPECKPDSIKLYIQQSEHALTDLLPQLAEIAKLPVGERHLLFFNY